MMDICARKQHVMTNYCAWIGRRRSSTKTSPNLGGHRTVPSWEMRFCATIGSVPWRRLLETKKYMDLHPNVVSWNDTAVEEAFDNAKRRYWAQINGLPCDIELPDPDVFIDKLDWEAAAEDDQQPDDEGEDGFLFKSVSDSESDDTVDDVVEEPTSVLDFQPWLCCNYGWDDIVEDEASPQQWRKPEEIKKVFGCDDDRSE